MTVSVVWHPACELHEPGPGHPERPDRIRAVLAALRAPDFESRVVWSEAQPADRAAIERVHTTSYVAALEQLAARGGGALDPDTYLGSRSFAAALAAAGVAIGAVEQALAAGRGGTAFGATRPPGHHALAARAMGFCFLNNVVIAARRAQSLGRARADRGLGRAPRQRHPGAGRARPVDPLRLHASVPMVSRHRCRAGAGGGQRL